jgi:hypothetical protein
MPVLLYIHQLFNAEHCQAYIHTLRWKERPLQCPRCQSQDVDPWGTYHYRPGCKALLVQRLPADLQRSDPYPAPPEPAVMRVLDSGHLPVVPVVFVATHCPGVGGP